MLVLTGTGLGIGMTRPLSPGEISRGVSVVDQAVVSVIILSIMTWIPGLGEVPQPLPCVVVKPDSLLLLVCCREPQPGELYDIWSDGLKQTRKNCNPI